MENKIKVDYVDVEKTWMGWKVTAFLNGEQVGDSPLLQTEPLALLYVAANYELPKDDSQ